MVRTVRSMRSGVTSAALVIAAIGLATSAEASVLNFDFGPTSVGSATNMDPYHASTGDVGNLTWNTGLGTGDITTATPLKYGDGTTATGVSVNIGVTSTTLATTSALGTQPSDSSALGLYYNTGIYGGNTSPARDAIFDRNGGGVRGITLQITGLAAGSYDIYYVGRNTNLNLGQYTGTQTYTQTMYAGTTATSGDFNYGTFQTGVITYTEPDASITTWAMGDTFTKLTVTVADGDYLDLAFVGAGQETRGFLNSLQLVSVPEPASFVVLSLGCLAMLACRKPRSQN